MTAKRQIKPVEIALAAGLAVGCGILASFSLSALSTPENFKTRVAGVESTLERASAMKPARTGSLHVEAADICSKPVPVEIGAWRNGMNAKATELGLNLTSLNIGPDALPGERDQIVGLRMRFEASGSYEGVLSLLDFLAQSKPKVFVDAVDLKSQTSSVEIVFTGRVFCVA